MVEQLLDPLDGPNDSAAQLRGVSGLDDVVHGLQLEGAGCPLAVPRHKDEPRRGTLLHQRLRHLDPRHVRKPDVEEDNVHAKGAYPLQSLGARARRSHDLCLLRLSQGRAEKLRGSGFILRYEGIQHWCHPPTLWRVLHTPKQRTRLRATVVLLQPLFRHLLEQKVLGWIYDDLRATETVLQGRNYDPLVHAQVQITDLPIRGYQAHRQVR